MKWIPFTMNAPVIRPRVGQLLFRLYGKPLHPELFNIFREHRLQHEDYVLTVWLTRSGHVVTWENPDVLLTEVTANEDQPLPEKRQLLSHRLRQEQCRTVECAHGVCYQTSFQVETVPMDVYLQLHDEILVDGRRSGLLHQFPRESSFSLAPLGYVDVQAMPGCLFLSCFHTFPDELTIVKTQSLIEKR